MTEIIIKMEFNDYLAENFNVRINNHLLYRQCLNYNQHRRNILVNLMKDVDNVEDIDFRMFKNPYSKIQGQRDIYLDLERHEKLLDYLRLLK